MTSYNHNKIEKKWQKIWEKKNFFVTSDKVKNKKNFYTLVEFPYPSGNLHTGHWYAFSVPDIFVRAKRMQGFNVLFPIGFDAFGLPAENAAIKHKLDPQKWTLDNIHYMRKQLRSMGASFDWSREVVTCDPTYYKWTQWLFLQMLKKGLAYQAETLVNWCPKDKTVLANEQVAQGKCERCGSKIEQRQMKQWMLKITDYADKLLKGLDRLDWSKEIKEAQKNWIGKSEGALIKFDLQNVSGQPSNKHFVEVFTTRPDTLFGATYIVLAPEHPVVENLKLKIENWQNVEAYIKKTKLKTMLERQQGEKEKTGVELKGIKAINPANKKEIPIFVADYVLGSYGTGAIMAVPAHDERDFTFAKKFKLPIKQVIIFRKEEAFLDPENVYTGSGLLINSGRFNSMESEKAKRAITEFVGGEITSQYRLRDWVLSRQRYWGTPIPVIHCKRCGVQPVPEKNLPVKLPEIKDYLPTGDGKSPLAKVKKWVSVKCPKCNGPAERETDTMDTFVDSSWYFLRYCDQKNKTKFADAKKMRQWMPVDLYSGGAEHTTMHLLYSRFFTQVLHDLKLVKWGEPYVVRKNRGIILGPDGQKMSKSKGNVINPDEYVAKLGADTVRMYLAFIGPYNEVGSYPWDPHGILGIRRFLDRVWKLGLWLSDANSKQVSSNCLNFSRLNPNRNHADSESGNDSKPKQFSRKQLLHKTIKKVTEDISEFHFNTAISQLMILLNEMDRPEVSQSGAGKIKEQFQVFLKLLAPFAPHLTEELWQKLSNPIAKSIHQESWPHYDAKCVEEDTFELVIQINGKMRDKLEAPIAISQKEIEALTFARAKVKTVLGDKLPRKIIFVPRRLINIVL